jgi:hypothetical protein
VSAALHIEELVLRVPGLDRARAAELGARVATALGERLGREPALRRDLGGLDLRLRISPDLHADRLVELLVDTIADRLR